MKNQGMKWNSLVLRMADYIRRNRMIVSGDSVCVGFSGGADSTFLLRALFELRKSGEFPPFTLSALHVNHCLRGEESLEDQEFARNVCRELGIEFYLYSYPVRDLAAADGISLEEEGRLVRQKAFRDCIAGHGVNRIALAHHANDQAETLLFRMARGTSLAGMGGIRPVNGNLIRPLLQLEKKEIEEALREQAYKWRTDSTNYSAEYARNAIRLEVIPCLEEHANSAAVRHMTDLAEDMALADDFLKETAAEKSGDYIESEEENRMVFLSDRMEEEAEIIQNYLILQALSLAAGRRKDLGREEISRIRDLLKGPSGRKADLPYGMEAVRRPEGILLRSRREAPKIISEEGGQAVFIREEDLQKGSVEVFFQGEMYRFTLISADEVDPWNIPRNDFTKWLDYDKIGPNLCLRHRMPGDFLQVSADGGRQKLKQLLIDRKVPKEERDTLAVLSSGSSVCWAVGLRISESCRITEETRRVLRVERIVT